MKGQPFDITADTVEYDRDRNLYTGRGNVRISQPGRTLTADWVSFSETTRQGVASGNVVIVEGGDTLTASFLQFDVDSMEGVVFDGKLDARASHFKMDGREVQKTGESTYVFREGVFTSCRCPDPTDRDPWSIRAEEADLEIGGYGTAKNSTFEVLGVPVIWLPWMIYPLKTERETGLLFPEIAVSGRNGAQIGLPFFWAATDELNLLLTPEYLAERGFKPKVAGEYVIGQESGGRFFGSFIHDTKIEEGDPSTPFSPDRWAGTGYADQFLPGGWRAKIDATFVSDNSYTFDFNELSEFRPDRFLESRGFVENRLGPSGRVGVGGAALLRDDQQNPDDTDRDRFVFHRLPELDVESLPMHLFGLPLVASLGADYSYFRPWKRADKELTSAIVGGSDAQFLDTGIDATQQGDERGPDGTYGGPDPHGDDFLTAGGPEGDGLFQEGEPLNDIGHRIQLTPRLAAPFRLGEALEVLPEVGWHQTLWQSAQQGFAERGFATGRLDLRTRLRGAFEAPFGLGPVTHLVEPRIGYALVTSVGQGDDPLFVPDTAFPQERIRQLDLDNVTLDGADRVSRFNGVTVGVGNRIYGRPPGEGAPRLLADVRISSQYDFSRSDLGDVFLEGTLHPTNEITGRFILGTDVEEPRVDEGLVEAGWYSPQGHDVSITYRFLRDIPRFFESFRADRDRFEKFESGFDRVNQISFNTRIALTRSWAVTYAIGYSFEQSLLLGNAAGVEYLSACRCWAIRVEARESRSRGFQFDVQYRLLGLGDDTVRPFQAGSGHGLAPRVGQLTQP